MLSVQVYLETKCVSDGFLREAELPVQVSTPNAEFRSGFSGKICSPCVFFWKNASREGCSKKKMFRAVLSLNKSSSLANHLSAISYVALAMLIAIRHP